MIPKERIYTMNFLQERGDIYCNSPTSACGFQLYPLDTVVSSPRNILYIYILGPVLASTATLVPLALSPSVPPGLGPVDLLTAVRDPFHVHPPHSYAMLVVLRTLALNQHIAVV